MRHAVAVGALVLVLATAAGAGGAAPGRWIAFREGGWIMLVRENGSGLHRFVRGWHPSWSRDGRTMLFASPRGFELIGADGSGRKVVPNTHQVGWNPVLSPDGTTIAYAGPPAKDKALTANPGAYYTAVWLIRTLGDHKRQVSPPYHGVPGGDDQPAFLPQGKLVVTHAEPAARAERSRSLVVLDVYSHRESRLVYGDSPAVRGGLLVFRASLDGNSQLYLADHRWSHGRRITKTPGNSDPALSPDGHRIAFARAGKRKGLYVVDTNGRHLRLLVRGDVSQPAWRPLGT